MPAVGVIVVAEWFANGCKQGSGSSKDRLTGEPLCSSPMVRGCQRSLLMVSEDWANDRHSYSFMSGKGSGGSRSPGTTGRGAGRRRAPGLIHGGDRHRVQHPGPGLGPWSGPAARPLAGGGGRRQGLQRPVQGAGQRYPAVQSRCSKRCSL